MIRKFFTSTESACTFLFWWNAVLTLMLAFFIGLKW